MLSFKKIWRDPDQSDPNSYLGPYFIMCCVLTAAILLYPFAHTVFGFAFLRIVFTAIMLAALYTVSRSPKLFRVLVVFLIPIVFANWTIHPIDSPKLSALASMGALAVMLVAIGEILRSIMTARRISRDIIFGAVAVYLLSGVMWATAYQTINDLDPGQVIKSVGEILTVEDRAALFPEFSYFSFITLTSVGYGDLAPIGAEARALAIVEGIFGQLYTAILIGKLVGMKVAQE